MAVIIGGSIKKKPSKNYHVNVIVDNDPLNEVSAVELRFTDDNPKNPQPSPSSFTLTKGKESKDGSIKTFEYKKLEFEGGSPIGLVYTAVTTMLDSSQKPMGDSAKEPVTVIDDTEINLSSMTLTSNDKEATSFSFEAVVQGKLSKVHQSKILIRAAEETASPADPNSYECTMTKSTSDIMVFKNEKVTFDKPNKERSTIGKRYLVILSLLDQKDNLIAELKDIVIPQ